MKCNYLTIEREYGSGGTKIARRLAEECGLPCYGVEIWRSVSQSIHVPVEQIQTYEESVSNSFLYTLFMMSRADGDNRICSTGKATSMWRNSRRSAVWQTGAGPSFWATAPARR